MFLCNCEAPNVELFLVSVIVFAQGFKRICEAGRKRQDQWTPADSMTMTCSTSNRQLRARIGLVSHERTTSNRQLRAKIGLVSHQRTNLTTDSLELELT